MVEMCVEESCQGVRGMGGKQGPARDRDQAGLV